MASSDPPARAVSAAVPLDRETEFETIYRAEAPWLVRFFRRKLSGSSDAQDLAHETMLRFMQAAPPTEIATPQAYLRRIARNIARNHAGSGAQRLARKSAPLIEGLDEPAGVDQHQIVAGQEELAVWEHILSRLKPRTLEVFLLSRVDGLTYQGIASQLDMTVFNVKWHMLQAIRHVERHRRSM